jgi:hypothetical protein
MELKQLIEEIGKAESRGMRFTCGFSDYRGRPAQPQPATPIATRYNARAVWNQAVEAALVKCRGNRKQAVMMAHRENPGLRELIVSQANPGKTTTTAAKPRAYRGDAKTMLEHTVQELMADGLSRQQAVSKAFKDDPSLRQSMVDNANGTTRDWRGRVRR